MPRNRNAAQEYKQKNLLYILLQWIFLGEILFMKLYIMIYFLVSFEKCFCCRKKKQHFFCTFPTLHP